MMHAPAMNICSQIPLRVLVGGEKKKKKKQA